MTFEDESFHNSFYTWIRIEQGGFDTYMSASLFEELQSQSVCARVCVHAMHAVFALLKLFSSGSTGVISITCGTFYLTLNYKPDSALSKLQHRPFAHNYVL